MTLMKKLLYFLILLYVAGCGNKSETGGEEASGEESKPTEEVANRIHQEVITEDTVNLPADQVWTLISDFGDLDKLLPGVFSQIEVEGEGEGAVRTMTLGDGSGEIVEKLLTLDPEAKYLEYEMTSSPMPVENYRASMAVRKLDDQSCVLTWISEYDVTPENENFKENMKGIHMQLFNTLNEIAESI